MRKNVSTDNIKLTVTFAIIAIIGGIVLLTFLYLGQNVHPFYYIGWLFLIPLAYLAVRSYNNKK